MKFQKVTQSWITHLNFDSHPCFFVDGKRVSKQKGLELVRAGVLPFTKALKDYCASKGIKL